MNRPASTRSPVLTCAAALALVASVACSSSTGPDGGSDVTHPTGIVSGRVSFGSRLDGIAVSTSGVAYVAKIDESAIGRFSVEAPYATMAQFATGNGPRDLLLDHAGATLYVGSNVGKVYVLDAATGTSRTTLSITGQTQRIALAPDDSRVFFTGGEGAQVWSLPTSGAAPKSGALPGGTPWTVAIAPSGGALYVKAIDGPLWRLDPTTLAVQTKALVSDGWALAVAPDGSEVYALSSQGVLYVLDGSTLAVRASLELATAANNAFVTPDGAQLYITSSGKLMIVDRVQRKLSAQITLGGSPMQVAFDKDGKTAFVTNLSGWVDVIR